MANSSSSNGLSFGAALTLLFVGLKLGGVIHWSWWWVLSPLWIGPLIFIGIFLILAAVAVIAKIIRTS